jgi:hypothetical protein
LTLTLRGVFFFTEVDFSYSNMKISTLFLQYLSLIGLAQAALPKLSITVQDGQYSDVYGLNPTASWSNNNKIGDIDFDYGIEADVRITSDITSLPKKLWSKVSSQIGPWGISVKGNFQGVDILNSDIEIGAANGDEGITLSLDGTCNSDGVKLSKVKGSKTFDFDGANVIINPSFDVQTEEATVCMSYEKEGTGINVEASKDGQTVTFSRQLDEENCIRPTFHKSGDMSIEWEHISDESIVTTTFKPEKSVNIKWEEGGWNTNVMMDLENTDITNVKVSVKKDLVF